MSLLYLQHDTTKYQIQQRALLHVLARTNQPDTEKAELIDHIYSKVTHAKALNQEEKLQEQTTLVDGCGHEDNSWQTHRKASQKQSLHKPKLPGRHLWLTTATPSVRGHRLWGGAVAPPFPPLWIAPSVHAPSSHGAAGAGLHTGLLGDNAAFMLDCFYA